MAQFKPLTGRFRCLNIVLLREKANRDDPRASFYSAMLAAETYEAYYRLAGSGSVEVESYRKSLITPHMEIMYARRNGWIEDI
jgi:hypothetical protein